MRRAFLLITLALALAPSDAVAGVAFVEAVDTHDKYGGQVPEMFFRADAGERNQLVLTPTNDATTTFVLRDMTANLRAGPGCSSTDARTVSCVASAAYLDAGDGDDRVTIAAGAYARVRGGPGDDELAGAGALAGGAGRDVLRGGPGGEGPAVLAGGGGDDDLHGGAADEVLSGDGDGPAWPSGHDDGARVTDAGGGDDRIDGGGGTDTVSYAARESGVRVDLRAASATGDGGERDELRDIEFAAGGEGADLLLGDGADNRLEGGSGNDRLDGRAGDDYLLGDVVPDLNEYSPTFTPADDGVDTLRGGPGADRLDAGGERGDRMFGDAGDDLLEALTTYDDTLARTVRCGSGTDIVSLLPRGALLTDCERMELRSEHARISPRPVRTRGALRFAASCVRMIPFDEPCKFSIAVKIGSSVVARGAASVAQGSRGGMRLRTRRALRRGQVLNVAVTVQSTPRPTARKASWRVKLR